MPCISFVTKQLAERHSPSVSDKGRQFENQYFEENPEFKVMGQALECATAPYTVKYNELYQPILTATQNCLLGDMSAEEAFTKGAEEITKIME